MSRALFVYWKLDAGTLTAAVQTASKLQAELRLSHPGLQTQLYRRTEQTGASATLMETYAYPGGVNAALQAAIEAAATPRLQPWCLGVRHVEAFEPLAASL